jgi:hypothetical protein
MPPWDEYKKPAEAQAGPWAAYAPAQADSAPPEPAKPKEEPYKPGKAMLDFIFGPAEAALNLGTSMVAKPVADVMGMSAQASDAMRDKPEGNAGAFKDDLQRSMTYEPRGETGKAIAQYNPLALIGKGVNAVGGGVEGLVAPPGASTGRQMAGAGIHEAINQAPGFLGVKAGGAGEAAQAALKGGARDMMQSALKPPIAAQRTGKAATAIDTLLDTGTNVSRAGADKLQARITDLNQQIADQIANSTAVVDKKAVAGNLNQVMADFKKQVNPDADIHSVQKAYDEFMDHPLLQGKRSVPVQLAQEMKQATYKSLGDKAYGEMKGADITAQKALARGLKDQIAKAVPEVRQLNAEDSKLLTTLPLVERRVLMDANKNPFGLGWLTTSPTKFAAWMADRSPAFKSIVAHMLNRSSAAAPGVAAGAVPGGLATNSYAGQLPQPPQQ